MEADNTYLEYVETFKQVSIPDYIELFSVSKKVYSNFFHSSFLLSCEYHNVLPKGLKIKSEAKIGSDDKQFFDNWQNTIETTQKDLRKLLVNEQERLLKVNQIKFWNLLIHSLGKVCDVNRFLKWFLKLYFLPPGLPDLSDKINFASTAWCNKFCVD